MSDNSFSEIREKGYIVLEEYFKKKLLKRVLRRVNIIYKAEIFLNYFGFGNKVRLGGNTFIGNLILKSREFIELISEVQKYLDQNYVNEYALSEYFLVSNLSEEYFNEWWHRDFPHSNENLKVFDNCSIGFFIPLGEFNNKTGSTKILPFSNKNIKLDPFKDHSIQLESKLGDLVIYDPRVFHTGGKNISGKPRHLLIAIYNRKEFIPCEDFEKQRKLIFLSSQRKMVNKLYLKRHKPFSNFFGRNKNASITLFRPIRAASIIFANFYYKTITILYFLWTRFIYITVDYLSRLKKFLKIV